MQSLFINDFIFDKNRNEIKLIIKSKSWNSIHKKYKKKYENKKPTHVVIFIIYLGLL